MKKKLLLLFTVLAVALSATGCGEDPALTKFRKNMDAFCQNISEIDTGINNIDASSENARNELLTYLDQLDQAFQVLGEMSVPEEFSYIEDLADEASSYMTTAVQYYHDAYSNNSYNEYTAEYARANYERACKRMTIIIKLLHGEDISDADVTFSEENDLE